MHTCRSSVGPCVVAALSLGAVACRLSDVGPSSAAYKAGELGNGGFVMACDDDVACRGSTNDAAEFPSYIATGSTFRVRYVPKTETDVNIRIDETGPEGSVAYTNGPSGSLVPVGDRFLTKAASGFLAKDNGLGMIMAKNAAGAILDYTSVNIVDADGLAVFENANLGGGSTPSRLSTKTVEKGASLIVRAVARRASENLAGSFATDWTSDRPDIIVVDTVDRSRATLRALAAGTATMKAEGRGLTSTFTVEVTE